MFPFFPLNAKWGDSSLAHWFPTARRAPSTLGFAFHDLKRVHCSWLAWPSALHLHVTSRERSGPVTLPLTSEPLSDV